MSANGVQIEYEIFGADAHIPLLLLMELAARLAVWAEQLRERPAGRATP